MFCVAPMMDWTDKHSNYLKSLRCFSARIGRVAKM